VVHFDLVLGFGGFGVGRDVEFGLAGDGGARGVVFGGGGAGGGAVGQGGSDVGVQEGEAGVGFDVFARCIYGKNLHASEIFKIQNLKFEKYSRRTCTQAKNSKFKIPNSKFKV